MSELRAKIIAYMRQKERNTRGEFCTWWFKFHVDSDTKTIRRELERMEREGLVTSDHSQSNNTTWRLTEKEPSHG
ncbi:hypothetical protein D9M68_138940 [compost metagenome]